MLVYQYAQKQLKKRSFDLTEVSVNWIRIKSKLLHSMCHLLHYSLRNSDLMCQWDNASTLQYGKPRRRFWTKCSRVCQAKILRHLCLILWRLWHSWLLRFHISGCLYLYILSTAKVGGITAAVSCHLSTCSIVCEFGSCIIHILSVKTAPQPNFGLQPTSWETPHSIVLVSSPNPLTNGHMDYSLTCICSKGISKLNDSL